jgi:hypothetical protein
MILHHSQELQEPSLRELSFWGNQVKISLTGLFGKQLEMLDITANKTILDLFPTLVR